MAGQIGPALDFSKLMLARYDTRGRRAWLRTWQAAPDTLAQVRGLTVDGSGNAVVAGSVLRGTPFSKALLASWAPSGKQRWARTSWKTMTDESAGNQDGLLVRCTASGAVKWWRVFDGDEHGDDWFDVVALWGKSSLFAGGVTSTAVGTSDVLAARYTR